MTCSDSLDAGSFEPLLVGCVCPRRDAASRSVIWRWRCLSPISRISASMVNMERIQASFGLELPLYSCEALPKYLATHDAPAARA
jgi:hypothetical protein